MTKKDRSNTTLSIILCTISLPPYRRYEIVFLAKNKYSQRFNSNKIVKITTSNSIKENLKRLKLILVKSQFNVDSKMLVSNIWNLCQNLYSTNGIYSSVWSGQSPWETTTRTRWWQMMKPWFVFMLITNILGNDLENEKCLVP